MEQFLNRISRVLKLDQQVYKEVRDDPNALKQALLVLILVGLFSAIGQLLLTTLLPSDSMLLKVFSGYGLLGLIIVPFLTIISVVIMSLIIHIIAKLLGGKASYTGFFKANAFSFTPAFLSILPIIGSFIGSIWGLVCTILAIKSTYEFTWGRTAAVILIVFALFVFLFFIFIFVTSLFWYWLQGVSYGVQ